MSKGALNGVVPVEFVTVFFFVESQLLNRVELFLCAKFEFERVLRLRINPVL